MDVILHATTDNAPDQENDLPVTHLVQRQNDPLGE